MRSFTVTSATDIGGSSDDTCRSTYIMINISLLLILQSDEGLNTLSFTVIFAFTCVVLNTEGLKYCLCFSLYIVIVDIDTSSDVGLPLSFTAIFATDTLGLYI